MSMAEFTLDEYTFFESDTVVHARTDAIIESRKGALTLPAFSTIVDLVQNRDVWCSRSAALELGMSFHLGIDLSRSNFNKQELVSQLCHLLQSAKIWHTLGLEIQFRPIDRFRQDCASIAICAELFDVTSRSLGTKDNIDPADLTNIRPPDTVLAYNLKAVNISLQFSAVQPAKGSYEHTTVRKEICHVVGNCIVISSMKRAIQRILGLDVAEYSCIQRQSAATLLDLAPTFFMPGFSEETHLRTQLLEAATSFLEKFDACQKKRAYPETTKDVSRKEISHNLWMTMTNKLRVKVLNRRQSPTWWTGIDAQQGRLPSNAIEAVSTLDRGVSTPDSTNLLDLDIDRPFVALTPYECLTDKIAPTYGLRIEQPDCRRLTYGVGLINQSCQTIRANNQLQHRTNERNVIILDEQLLEKQYCNVSNDRMGIHYPEDAPKVLQHGRYTEALVDIAQCSSMEDGLSTHPPSILEATFLRSCFEDKDGHSTTLTLHDLFDDQLEYSTLADISATEGHLLHDLEDIDDAMLV